MRRWAELWTEYRPAPLVLTDTEILDWLNEYCDEAVYRCPTPERPGGFTLHCYDIKTSARPCAKRCASRRPSGRR